MKKLAITGMFLFFFGGVSWFFLETTLSIITTCGGLALLALYYFMPEKKHEFKPSGFYPMV